MKPNQSLPLVSALALMLLGSDRPFTLQALDGSKESVRQRLRAMERRSAPAVRDLRTAMCYEPSAPPEEHSDYVCPTCGQRTLYARVAPDAEGYLAIELVRSGALTGMRASVKELPGLQVSLDESSLCHHCSPDAKRPSVTLIVAWPDGLTVRTANPGSWDLELLDHFTHADPKRGPKGLPEQEGVHRLKTLLGLP